MPLRRRDFYSVVLAVIRPLWPYRRVLLTRALRSLTASSAYVVYNATVRTSNTVQPSATAFAVENGVFLAVGNDEDVRTRFPELAVTSPGR